MTKKLPSHSERCEIRQSTNGKVYPDNPKRLPYNNMGELIKADATCDIPNQTGTGS